MSRSYFKWIIFATIACVGIIALFMWKEKQKENIPKHEEVIPRPFSPYKSYIAGVGIVEASSGNIFIGSPVNRVVDKIEVKVGQKVKEGEVLFRLDDHDLAADLLSRQIDYEDALANLKKLESFPRPEDISVAEAQLNSAKTELEQAKSHYQKVEGLDVSGAMSQQDVNQIKYAYQLTEAKYQQVLAEYKKVKEGTWQPDLDIARLKVKQSKTLVQRIEADIAKTIIRAPTDATVLQIKIHEGEFPPSDTSRTPPMIIGNIDKLHLRVSINQFDASFFDPKSPAVAYLQGNSQIEFPLTFVNLEPYFVPKQNLNNDITEKVDTRVLQAIYCFQEGEQRIYVGQQMDVYIETHFPTKAEK